MNPTEKPLELIAEWDDGTDTEVMGYFFTPQEALAFANQHEYTINPFTREHVTFKVRGRKGAE